MKVGTIMSRVGIHSSCESFESHNFDKSILPWPRVKGEMETIGLVQNQKGKQALLGPGCHI